MNAGFKLFCCVLALFVAGGFGFYINQKQQITIAQKPMVVIIPSYNNIKYYKKNLDSIFMQNYANYRVVYIDDCSKDGTYEAVKNYISERNFGNRVTLIKNEQNQGALSNLYHTIHSCKDHEIMVTVDGDDLLAHENVLSYLNKVYQDKNVWITFGQFVFWPAGNIGYCDDIPKDAIDNNEIRKHCGLATHLRTFYAGLFKKIKYEDLLYEGKFYAVTWDKAMMAPMLEMSNGKWKFIPDILYIYNYVNPLSDARLYGTMQNVCAAEIKAKPPYKPVEGALPFVMA